MTAFFPWKVLASAGGPRSKPKPAADPSIPEEAVREHANRGKQVCERDATRGKIDRTCSGRWRNAHQFERRSRVPDSIPELFFSRGTTLVCCSILTCNMTVSWAGNSNDDISRRQRGPRRPIAKSLRRPEPCQSAGILSVHPKEEETLVLDVGEFCGTLVEDKPEGHGVLTFKGDDPMGRLKYDGDWQEGRKTGHGVMTFVTGDVYEGIGIAMREKVLAEKTFVFARLER